MATELERIRLEKRRGALLGQRRGLGNLMRGSLVTARVQCGRPTCACAQGRKHEKLHLSVNLKKRTRTTYVGERRAEEVGTLLDEYRRARRLIEELTEVNLDLLRPTRHRKAGKEVRR